MACWKSMMLLQVAVKNAQQAKQQAELAMAECEQLRHQLKASETARQAMENKMKVMSLDAHDWELALDSLQVQTCPSPTSYSAPLPAND